MSKASNEMDKYGIKNAIVTHTASVNYDPATGNEMLFNEIKYTNRFMGCFVLLADYKKKYIDMCIKERKMRFARMFPKTHNFSIKSWCSGIVLKELEERKIPLILLHNELVWDDIELLCKEYPDLPIIIDGDEGSGRKILYYNRFYYPLFKKNENIYLEIHNLSNYLIIELCSNRINERYQNSISI